MGVLYDFSGYATKNDIKCSDGRTIRKNAFLENDGKTVPLVWQHLHDDPFNVLGHALLENREDGVYAYCKFNETDAGQNAKELVKHGDITHMSIYANKLKQNGGDVIHGAIREVSLVLSPANPGARIQSLCIEHSDEFEDDRAVIFTDEEIIRHSEEDEDEEDEVEEVVETEEVETTEETIEHADKEKEEMADNKDKTVGEVFDELTEEQKNVVYFMIGQALEEAGVDGEDVKHSDDEGEEFMKYNVFEGDDMQQGGVLTHSDMEEIFSDARRNGSLKESFLAHAEANEWGMTYEEGSYSPDYGVANIDYLFPDARLDGGIQYVTRRMDWVAKVMNGVHRSPISRIKSIYADLTQDEARARGYIKGKMKKEQVFGLLKRTTSPTTVYKKQKLDRDDVLDITDFDIVAEIKKEMRMMLDEELATAFLIGDGRSTASDDKINESCIRPIWTDADLFTIKHEINVASSAPIADKADAMIDAAVIAMDEYEGTGSPTLFAPQNWVTQMLLLRDVNGRRIYKDTTDLAAAMTVSTIVPVSTMKGKTRQDDDGNKFELAGIIVNLNDYVVGADKGGAVNMFDDFDIDYNQMKYLIETRCSGSLTKPHSAIALEFKVSSGS